jgi:GGDEF domain-containing protein
MRQRVMAERDPLTELHNRRSFDAALEHALEAPEGVALILFDFDDFKAVNDLHGHPVGDEFAVIAPSAGSAGVARIVAALEEAIAGADLPPQVPTIAASFAWAVAPHDAVAASQLLDCADQRLLYRKRLNKTTF